MSQLGHRLISARDVDNQAAFDDRLQLAWEILPELTKLPRTAAEASDHRVLRRLSAERKLPREELEGEDAKRKDIAPAVEHFAADLLGAHELGCAEHDPRLCEFRELGTGPSLLGKPEVHDDCSR